MIFTRQRWSKFNIPFQNITYKTRNSRIEDDCGKSNILIPKRYYLYSNRTADTDKHDIRHDKRYYLLLYNMILVWPDMENTAEIEFCSVKRYYLILKVRLISSSQGMIRFLNGKRSESAGFYEKGVNCLLLNTNTYYLSILMITHEGGIPYND